MMEHGLHVLEGKVVYRLNLDWVGVEAGDCIRRRSLRLTYAHRVQDGSVRDVQCLVRIVDMH